MTVTLTSIFFNIQCFFSQEALDPLALWDHVVDLVVQVPLELLDL